MRIEGSFYNYKKNLSEYSNGESRGFALENAGDYFSTDYDIYGKNKYVAVYPALLLYVGRSGYPDTFCREICMGKGE